MMIASPWSSVKGVPTGFDSHAPLVSKTFRDDFSNKGLNTLTDFANRGTGILPVMTCRHTRNDPSIVI